MQALNVNLGGIVRAAFPQEIPPKLTWGVHLSHRQAEYRYDGGLIAPQTPREDKLRVFVYGTLKPGEINYQRYCAGKVIEEKPAIAFGKLFALPLGYPAMTLGESIVKGFLLTFTDSTILTILDELEDYNPNRITEENEYYRQEIEIYDLDLKFLGLAWVYLMTFTQIQQLGGMIISSGCWRGNCDLQ